MQTSSALEGRSFEARQAVFWNSVGGDFSQLSLPRLADGSRDVRLAVPGRDHPAYVTQAEWKRRWLDDSADECPF